MELFGKIDAAVSYFGIEDEIDFENLSEDETKILMDAAAAYQVVLATNQRLIVSIAKKIAMNTTVPLIDLIAEGNEGLARAVQKFDVGREFKFSTYAVQWVRQSITRAIADKSRLVRLPVHAHDRYIRMVRELRELSEYFDRPATIADLCEITGENVKTLEGYYRTGRGLNLSLDQTFDGDKPSTTTDQGTALGDLLEGMQEDPINEELFHALMKEEVSELFAHTGLSRREKFILSFRNGLDLPELHGLLEGDISYDSHAAYGYVRTLEETGDIFGLTRERIRQIELNAMGKIRSKIDSDLISVDISSLDQL